MGWCQLRQLQIHPELATELWCHHWTARPPRLPVLAGGQGAGATDGSLNGPLPNQQLSLDAVLGQS